MNQLKMLADNIQKVFVGKNEVTELIILSLISNGHVLLEDVPGTGKTVLAKTLAKSVDGKFSRIQFTPDVLPGDVTGIEYFNPKTSEFEVRVGPIKANILLADEINRAMPRTQSSLLEAMAEGQVTIDRHTEILPQPFLVIATQNPFESQGTFPLPDAQLDRFFMCLSLGYPSIEQEKELIRRFRNEEPLAELSSCITGAELLEVQAAAKRIEISEPIEDYILGLVSATRNHPLCQTGLSPRASLALVRGAQAKALFENRSYCLPEDVQFVFPHIAAHRITLSMEGSLTSGSREVLVEILSSVDVPVEIAR
ncbi:magnesium chelatase [Bacillus sp. M6-12]|uniref:AAA family ATPase n=1 Tax=Bacillus sp. M6-12 TaxID=2054166 RepID=UPI000C788D66|nr:MoxR family ATPase [Bacillus sp. M6-12]PLS17108.1 magnesium chelatase [Bacillus sp. M6-12]